MPCKGKSEADCGPPECKFVKGAKRQFCRAATNKKAQTPKKAATPTRKASSLSKGSSRKTLRVKFSNKVTTTPIDVAAPPAAVPRAPSVACKGRPEAACLPPECKFVKGAKRQYCKKGAKRAAASRAIRERKPTPKPSLKPPTPPFVRLELARPPSVPKATSPRTPPPPRSPAKPRRKAKTPNPCKGLAEAACLPPECKFVKGAKRQYCKKAPTASGIAKKTRKGAPAKVARKKQRKRPAPTPPPSVPSASRNTPPSISTRTPSVPRATSPRTPPIPPASQEKVKTVAGPPTKRPKAKKVAKREYKKPSVHVPDAVRANIAALKAEGVAFLYTLEGPAVGRMIDLTNRVYRNGEEPLMSDALYDLMWDFAAKHHPDLPQLGGVDYECSGRMQKLPIYMSSLNKLKDSADVIRKQVAKFPGDYVLSDKLDGISALFYAKQGEKPRLFTKGNGTIGQDISEVMEHVQHLPIGKLSVAARDYVIRGELIMSKAVYEAKYALTYKSPRYAVASAVLARDRSQKRGLLEDVEFVTYQQITPKAPPSQQFEQLRQRSELKLVYHKTVSDKEVTADALSAELRHRRSHSPYPIDGIVVAHDAEHRLARGDPKHNFAFKMLLDDQQAETTVTGVEWRPTKQGHLFPVIHVEKVQLPTGRISKMSGNNGRFIEANGIGVGAKVVVARSGDIIPQVVKVLSPADTPATPDEYVYKWDARKVHYVLVSVSPNPRVQVRRIMHFFHSIGGYHLAEATITLLYNHGFQTVRDFIGITKEKLLDASIRGIKEKRAARIADTIANALKRATPIMLLDATGRMGSNFGPKKVFLIAAQYPDAFDVRLPREQRLDGLMSLKGFGKLTAEKFLKNLARVYDFFANNHVPFPDDIVAYFKRKNETMSNFLVGVNVVFSDVLNNDALEARIVSEGANIQAVPDGTTTDVVTGNTAGTSSKLELARELCLPIYTVAQFKSKYNL